MPNIFKTIAGAVGKAAPLLGKALLGPVGGTALNIVKGALGLKDEASEADVLSRVQNLTAADVQALKDSQQKHIEFLVDATVRDRADARDLAKEHGLTHHAIISYTVLGGYIFLMVGIGFGWLDAESLLGWQRPLDMAFAAILGFWFGSSFGSKVKDGAAAVKAKLFGE